MRFSRQDYWSGLPWPPPGDLPNPAIEPAFLMSSALAGRFFTTSATWKAPFSGVIEHFQLISISQENGRGLLIPTSKLLGVWFFSEEDLWSMFFFPWFSLPLLSSTWTCLPFPGAVALIPASAHSLHPRPPTLGLLSCYSYMHLNLFPFCIKQSNVCSCDNRNTVCWLFTGGPGTPESWN